jgi:NAD(P)-dependent dehydrogenase (short-subunit alcohol dehydrogenase family)
MGAAITRGFAAEGTHVALLARDTEALNPLADEVRAMGVEALVIGCDVTDADAAHAAVAEIAEAWDGVIDILVNIAGGTGPVGASGVETTEAEFDQIVALNQRGPFTMIRAGSSTWAAPSACGGAPGGWPIPRRNGASGA